MRGDVREWTAGPFLPFPGLPLSGFSPDADEAHSEPAFGSRKVLRGSARATRGSRVVGTCRDAFGPERRDVPSGFRTVGL